MAWGHLPFDCGDLNLLLGSHLMAASNVRVSEARKTPTIILNHHLTTKKKHMQQLQPRLCSSQGWGHVLQGQHTQTPAPRCVLPARALQLHLPLPVPLTTL